MGLQTKSLTGKILTLNLIYCLLTLPLDFYEVIVTCTLEKVYLFQQSIDMMTSYIWELSSK